MIYEVRLIFLNVIILEYSHVGFTSLKQELNYV